MDHCRTRGCSWDFILIGSEKVGMIWIKFKKLQLHSAWAFGQVSNFTIDLVSAAALWLEDISEKPKALWKSFVCWQAKVALEIKARHVSLAWEKWSLDSNDGCCQGLVWYSWEDRGWRLICIGAEFRENLYASDVSFTLDSCQNFLVADGLILDIRQYGYI